MLTPEQLATRFTVRLNESVVCGVNVTNAAERQRFSLVVEIRQILGTTEQAQ